MIDADEKFVQCFPRMGTENFQYDVNIEGVMKQDADSSIKAGILLQALQQSQRGPVVLVIDELDKARPEVDSFLLDFLENGRLTTGTDTYEKGEFPIYTFITSNDKREIDEQNRMFRIALNKGHAFVFLDSDSPNTLEAFLGQQIDNIEQGYDTDKEYDDNGRDY